MKRTDFILDLVAFLVTLGFAVAGRWEAKDIIWGLWASSLCFGYFFIVVAIFGPVLRTRGRMRLLAFLGGLFMLAFFTVHFGMFHFVHGVFLNSFFPLVAEKRGFPNILTMLAGALHSYWPVVVATFISRATDLPFRATEFFGQNDVMAKPYANVIRMHLLIFVFAGLHAAGLVRYAVYPILIFYFFPFGALLRRKAKKPEEAKWKEA